MVRPVTWVRNVWKSFREESGLERHLFSGSIDRATKAIEPVLAVTRAQQGRVEFKLYIQDRHTNRLRILHGGTIASLVDFGGSLAVASHGLFSTGVTTDLNVSYLSSGGKVGDQIKVEATCDKLGGTLAYTTVKIFNDRNSLVARGSHTKYIKDAQESQAALGGKYKYPEHVKAEIDKQKALSQAPKDSEAAQTDAMQATGEEDQTKVEEATEEVKAAEQPTEEVKVTEQSTEEEKTKE